MPKVKMSKTKMIQMSKITFFGSRNLPHPHNKTRLAALTKLRDTIPTQ